MDRRVCIIMKQLSSFMVLNIEGGDRVSYTYNELSESGDLMSANSKKSFFALDPELVTHIKAIRQYIQENKLEG